MRLCTRIHSLTPNLPSSFTHSLTHPLTHSLTHSHAHSLTHSPTHSPTHSLTRSLIHSLTHSLTHQLTYSLTLTTPSFSYSRRAKYPSTVTLPDLDSSNVYLEKDPTSFLSSPSGAENELEDFSSSVQVDQSKCKYL